MADSLIFEALLTHFYRVGGRVISAPPPGSGAILAPRRANRARQDETLFVLLTPVGPVKAQASFYQTCVQTLAQTYFKSSGGITGALREALGDLNRELIEQQQRLQEALRLGVLCAVLRDQEIYLARLGPMLAAFKTREAASPTFFPLDRSREALSFAPPLGHGMEPRPDLTRFELTPHSVLLLGDGSFLALPPEALAPVFSAPDLSAMLESLRTHLTAPLCHASLIEFVPEDSPSSPHVAIAAPQALSGVVTPLAASLPPVPEKPSDTPPPRQASETPAPDESSPPTSAESETPRGENPVSRLLARTLSGLAESTEKLSETILPEEEEDAPPRYPLLSNLLVLLAVLLPLGITIAVVGLVLSQAGTTAYELCRDAVLQRRDAARQLTPEQTGIISEESIARAREQWALVLEEAQACEEERPGDEEMLYTAGEAQNNLDRFDRITRRTVSLLRRFPPQADLRGPISSNWITLYTLDRAGDAVYEDILSATGENLVQVSQTPLIFRGQNIGGEIVGELVDITWLVRGGLPSGNTNVPLALDESGLLIWYSEVFGENETLRLVLPTTWGRPVALVAWRLNLYILDPLAQQIWRYVPNAGLYSEVPQEYFTAEVDRSALSQAVDFDIDEEGSIYVLLADGRIKKYRGGVEQTFALFNLPRGALATASSLAVDNNPLTRGLLITDPASGTLYTVSLGGTVNTGYRPLNQLDALQGISGALVNPSTNSIYLLARDSLYRMPRQ
jgi:hypothetical protein